MPRRSYSRPTVPWVAMDSRDQLRFDNILREKRAEVLGLKPQHHVYKLGGHKVSWCKWCDNFGRVYHYEVIDHSWVGFK